MFKTHFWRTLGFAILGGVIGLLLALFGRKVYEANTEMLLGESPVSNAASVLDPQVQRILEAGVARDAQTELQLVRSQTVYFNAFRAAIEELEKPGLMNYWLDYYLMYDVIALEQRAGVMDTGSVASIRVRAYDDPKLAERIAAKVTDVYNDLRIRNAQNSSANAISYLASQVEAAKTALDEAEKNYKEYAEQEKVANIDVAVNSQASLVNNLRVSAVTARQFYEGKVRETESLRSSLRGIEKTITGSNVTAIKTELTQLQARLAEQQSQLAGLRERYHEDHPRVKETAQQVRDALSRIKALKADSLTETQVSKVPNPVYAAMEQQLAIAESQQQSAEKQLSEAESALAAAETRLQALPAIDSEVRNRRRNLEVAELNYRRVKVQLDELENRRETGARMATVLSEPRAYQNHVAPDLSKYVFIGVIAGICVGLIFSFSLESLRLRVHNSQQLAELTGLPVVATVPKLPRGQTRTPATLAKLGATPSETFRNMAFTMLAKTEGHSPQKATVFTAVGEATGRSSSTLQFAMAMAATGVKVILVDADPVRAAITKAFGASGKAGMSEIVAANTLPAESSSVFEQTVHDNLSLLPAGNSTEGLGARTTEEIERFFAWVTSQADMVVFDMPPCDLFADASRLASYVDEVCVVVSASSTSYQHIPNGYDILTRSGAKNVSLILTDASAQEEPFADTRRYRRTV